MLFIFWARLRHSMQAGKQIRQAVVKTQLFIQIAQALIGQALEAAVFHETDQVVQIDRIVRDARATFGINIGQGVNLFPELLLIDPKSFKDRRLHVARNECLIEIPNTGDDVLAMKVLFRHCR